MALSSSHRSPARLIAVVAVVAIATIAAGGFYVRAIAAPNGSSERLARIVGAHRITRARLSGGFSYAKCEADSVAGRLVQGLACRSPARSTWSSAEKLGSFAQELRETPDSTRSHVAGIWELVWGRTDEALKDLREAARRGPKDARALNDLGVAFTVYAAEHDDPSALVDAFVVIDSAIRADSTIDEVRFNHALLLEQLQLRAHALGEWARYLRHDMNSRWADEAAQHIAELSRHDSLPSLEDWRRAGADSQTIIHLVARDLTGARDFAQRELGDWARAARAGDTAKAWRHLTTARVVANGFRARTGDALVSDGIAVIDRVMAENNGVRLNALIDGHAALSLGLDSMRAPKVGLPALLTARRRLGSAASPMALWALLFQARSRVNFPKDSSLAWLTSIRDSAPLVYTSLRMSAVQYVGYIHDLQLDYVHAIAAYDSALAENRGINDPELTLRTASWLSQCQEVLRGREPAWRTLYAALVASHDVSSNPIALFTAFDYATQATVNDAPRLALLYAAEAIRSARAVTDQRTFAYALRDRAGIHTRLGHDSLARADISLAKAAATLLENSKLSADVDLAGAYVTMRSAPTKAVAELRGVIDEYLHGETKDQRGLSLAYLYIAQAQAAAGMIDSARVAFDSATMLMQRQRASLSNLGDRGAFLDAARSVIDQILAFHAEHDAAKAFEFFEGTRSRVLLDQLSNSSSFASHPALSELQRRLTKDDLVLSYAVMPRGFIVWAVGRDRLEQRRVAFDARELEHLVMNFRESVRTANGEPDSLLGSRLYRLLVDSTNTLDAKNLIVIPDGALHFLPFAALRNPATRRLVVLDRTVSYEPSATLLLSSLSESPQRFSRSSKILAIGNPAFDTSAFQLPYLPAAEGEAFRIARLYNDQSALLRKDATDRALEAMGPQAEIIHFAGHAMVSRDAPQLSHLVLASDGRSAGVVFSTEIARWQLKRTRLVVLSACSTADGKLSATEGASSLARAFFAAGVPSVVSSLWAIDDDDSAEFFLGFHGRLAAGQSAAAALQEAQIKWLNDGGRRRAARSWAAFQLFGHP